jgi:ribonuclease VapC
MTALHDASVIAVDSSALIAIVKNEPERERFLSCISPCKRALVSSATLLESRVVIFNQQGHTGYQILEELLGLPVFEVIAQSQEEIDVAYEAFLMYGKGNRHKAQLNFGDLFSYALAKSRNIPLLYKGEDFAHTDVRSALA